jgi:hypothetical protein
MHGLMLISGVLEVLDQCPKRIEAFTDAIRASLLLGRERERELDGGSGGVSMILAPLECGVFWICSHP